MIEPALRTPPADSGKAVTDSYIKAVNLNRKIITAAQLAQQSLYDMCMGFKEMRDSKLYKELGYSDFGEYCEEETGIKRRQVYSYIQVAEKLPTDFVQSTAQIGVQKLYLLSSISEEERTEITAKTDIESTSVRELEQQIKQLKAENEKKLAELTAENEQLKAEPPRPVDWVAMSAYNSYIEQSNTEREEVENELLAEKRKAYKTETYLREQIKELENRPVEISVQKDEKTIAELEELRKKYALAKSECERLEEAAQNTVPVTVADTKPVFKAYLTTAFDAFKRLAEYTKSSGNETYIAKVKDLINTFTKTMEENNETI